MTTWPIVWVLAADLSRSGVPVVLQRLADASGPDQRGRLHVVAKRGGELHAEIRRTAASVTVLEPTGRRSLADAAAAGLGELGLGSHATRLRGEAWRRRVRDLPRPDVVVVHGAGGAPLLDIVPSDTPVVTHLHELATGLRRSLGPDGLDALVRRSTAVLAVSEPVAAIARAAGGPSPVVVPGMVGDIPDDRTRARRRAEARQRLDLAGATLAVMAVGAPGWRKGSDRFVALAAEVARLRPDTSWHWVGGAPTGRDASWVEAECPVTWHDALADPWTLASGADLIVVPSREDPMPLVALEAAASGIAVVSARSGGLVDLLPDEALSDAADMSGFARTIDRWLDETDRRAALADTLRARVIDEHAASTVTCRWWTIVADASRSAAGGR